MYSFEDIQNMSDEEKRELEKKALLNFGSFFLVKWGLIFGVTYLLKKWIKSLPDE